MVQDRPATSAVFEGMYRHTVCMVHTYRHTLYSLHDSHCSPPGLHTRLTMFNLLKVSSDLWTCDILHSLFSTFHHCDGFAQTIMSPQLPQPWQAFAASIRDFISYPENVVHRTTYLDALSKYKIQLDDIEKKLFVTKDQEVNVPFRDLIDPGQDLDLLETTSVQWLMLGSVREE